jgi:vanillate O-demethylase monooxygenase subunit
LLDEPVVLYRTGSGEVVALADRCIHRGYPLSLGAVDGERIVCGYHGFTYDAGGLCVAIPSQTRVPPAYAVRRYPTLERGGAVWIWMGAHAPADEALLPDLAELGLVNPQFRMTIGGTIRLRCRSELIHENLLDLSHIGFLHPGSIGTARVTEFPAQTSVSGNVVEASRTISDDVATSFHLNGVGIPVDSRMDRTTRSLFFAPAAHVTHVRMVAPGSDAKHGAPGYFGEFRNAHLITPVSQTETLYFWTASRTSKLDAETTAYMLDSLGHVYEQDRLALEHQEQSLAEAEDFRELSCAADEAALKARGLIAHLMRLERAG